MKTKAYYIKQALLRGGLVLLFMGMGSYFAYRSGDMKLFRTLLAVTIMASSMAAFNVMYEYDIWSVKKKIFLHTIAMFITVYPALLISGWFDTSQVSGYLIALLSFISFGILFASVAFLVSKFILKNVPEEPKK